MSIGDIVLAGYVDGIEHSIDVGKSCTFTTGLYMVLFALAL